MSSLGLVYRTEGNAPTRHTRYADQLPSFGMRFRWTTDPETTGQRTGARRRPPPLGTDTQFGWPTDVDVSVSCRWAVRVDEPLISRRRAVCGTSPDLQSDLCSGEAAPPQPSRVSTTAFAEYVHWVPDTSLRGVIDIQGVKTILNSPTALEGCSVHSDSGGPPLLIVSMDSGGPCTSEPTEVDTHWHEVYWRAIFFAPASERKPGGSLANSPKQTCGVGCFDRTNKNKLYCSFTESETTGK